MGIVVGQSNQEGVIFRFYCDWLPIGACANFEYHEDGSLKVTSNERVEEIQPFWNYGQPD